MPHARSPTESKPNVVRVPQAQVRKTVLLLRQARRPLIVVGSQALLEVDRADELADALASLGAPTYLVNRANGLLPPTKCVPSLGRWRHTTIAWTNAGLLDVAVVGDGSQPLAPELDGAL